MAVGSHCVQTHISYTVLVGGLLGGAVAWLGVVWWRTDRLAERHPLRWLLIGTATLIVAWLPPVIEQLQPGTGNLRKLYEQFTDPGEPFVGSRAAVKAMIGRFNLLGPWIIDAQKDPLSTPNYIGFVLFAALVACLGAPGVEATRADRTVAVRGADRGDRVGAVLDDANLRRLLRVRDPLDAPAGRAVGRDMRVVVLAHLASRGGHAGRTRRGG